MNARAADFAHHKTKELLHKFVSNVESVKDKVDEDGVHDLRVSIRRLTAALRIFSVELGRKRVRKVRRGLRLIMSAAGGVRDRDIALRLLAEAGVPADSELVSTVKAQLHHASQELRKAIDRADPSRFAKKLEF